MCSQVCLEPTASLISEKLFSRTFILSPLIILETTEGPLKTNAEYNCINEAPEIIISQADSTESIPPTPIIGTLESV